MKKLIATISLIYSLSSYAYGFEIPCRLVGDDGKPNGKISMVIPYKDRAEIITPNNTRIVVPYYGDADGAGWEYQNERWVVLIGKSSESRISVMAAGSKNDFICGGFLDLPEIF
ncbi:hypothetical protein PROVRUST_05917 [Providencia rustigianii DSM 4541]|uniref:Uncharacterized protein n=2 Tax=Providencia rustigianii TaxID=158850 RepID=D1P199_9GAMM|nr:hypothetical protein PROVRUST_05917 [Providencia rustigianii DSM 4541]